MYLILTGISCLHFTSNYLNLPIDTLNDMYEESCPGRFWLEGWDQKILIYPLLMWSITVQFFYRYFRLLLQDMLGAVKMLHGTII